MTRAHDTQHAHTTTRACDNTHTRARTRTTRSELRTKDLERIGNFLDDLKAREKRGLTKDQKEDMAIAAKIDEWLKDDHDVRCVRARVCACVRACGVRVLLACMCARVRA